MKIGMNKSTPLRISCLVGVLLVSTLVQATSITRTCLGIISGHEVGNPLWLAINSSAQDGDYPLKWNWEFKEQGASRRSRKIRPLFANPRMILLPTDRLKPGVVYELWINGKHSCEYMHCCAQNSMKIKVENPEQQAYDTSEDSRSKWRISKLNFRDDSTILTLSTPINVYHDGRIFLARIDRLTNNSVIATHYTPAKFYIWPGSQFVVLSSSPEGKSDAFFAHDAHYQLTIYTILRGKLCPLVGWRMTTPPNHHASVEESAAFDEQHRLRQDYYDHSSDPERLRKYDAWMMENRAILDRYTQKKDAVMNLSEKDLEIVPVALGKLSALEKFPGTSGR